MNILDSLNTTMNSTTIGADIYNSCSTTSPSIVNNNYSWSTGLPFTGSAIDPLGWSSGNQATIKDGKIILDGENSDIIINGKSLLKLLHSIEDRLGILEPNPKLENDWEELKELGNKYRELEAKIKEKLNVWKVLESND